MTKTYPNATQWALLDFIGKASGYWVTTSGKDELWEKAQTTPEWEKQAKSWHKRYEAAAKKLDALQDEIRQVYFK